MKKLSGFIIFFLKIFDSSNQNLKNQQFFEYNFQVEIPYKNVIAGNTIVDFFKNKL